MKTKALHLKKIYRGFTLVELIVVITILVILGTIVFLNLGGFQGNARDSLRISNLTNLKKGLDMFQVRNGVYPKPESAIDITASGVVLGYQGFTREQIENIAKISLGATKDPLDSTMYTTYSTNLDGTKMQAMIFMEDTGSITTFIPNIIPQSFASSVSDYSNRFPNTTGDSLGILLDNETGSTKNQPVQELYNATFTGVDIVNTTRSYVIQFSNNEKVSGSGTVLRTGIVSSKGLIGYWNFNEGSGTTAYDTSGLENNGTLTGTVSWTGGKVGGAAYFPGNNSSKVIIYTGSLKGFNNLQSLTMSSWVYYDSGALVDMYATIIFKASSFGLLYANSLSGRLIGVPYGNFMFNGIFKNSGPYNYYTKTLPVRTWIHLTTSFDGTNKRIKFYYDGALLANISIQGTQIDNSAFNLAIGGHSLNLNQYWKGLIDEVRIYNRALSDSEVRALYNATK